MELCYRLFGLIHQFTKFLLRRSRLSIGNLLPTNMKLGCAKDECLSFWQSFVESSIIKDGDLWGIHYAGYVAESKEWCHPSWIWTNAAIVRLYCMKGEIDNAVSLGDRLASFQQDCGGWIVRNDYDIKGAIPMLAPNDSAYLANNAFLSLYEVTKDRKYLDIAIHCADWIIDSARPDGLVYTGYNMRDEKWSMRNIIVDIGFTGGLFSKLVELTGNERYKSFLKKFVLRYVELFYIPTEKGFCTSIGKNDNQQGGMFTRGQAWALEGLIPAYRVLKDNVVRNVIEATIDTLIKQQYRNGGWPYNLTCKLMGEDCKAVSVVAKGLLDWYSFSRDERILVSARKALNWCCKHTAIDGIEKGGIFSYSIEGAIVKEMYTSCAFVYASVYALELELQLNETYYIN